MNKEKIPAARQPQFSIYQPVTFNRQEYYVIAILGDCGNSGTVSYQLGKWDGNRFFPGADGVKEESIEKIFEQNEGTAMKEYDDEIKRNAQKRKAPKHCLHRRDEFSSAGDYRAWHLDADRRTARGEKQKLCQVCGKLIWEHLWRKSK